MTSCMNPVAALGELLTVTGTPLQCDLLELCCPPDSRLVSTMLDHGQRALRIGLPAIDLSTKVGLQEVKGMIKKHRPKVLWISLPCGPYSPIQKLFNEDTPEKKEKSLLRKRHARKWIRNGIEAARTQLHLGGDLGWEWPKNKDGWHVQEMRQFLQALKHLGVYHEANIHGCAHGLDTQKANYLKKPWQVVLTSQMMAIKCSGTKMPRSRVT